MALRVLHVFNQPPAAFGDRWGLTVPVALGCAVIALLVRLGDFDATVGFLHIVKRLLD